MTNPSTFLLEFARNIYSQTGEDGVIERIRQVLPRQDAWCVEFGAWDGLHLSNTRNLIEHMGYSAVLIEGNQEKFSELQRNYSSRQGVIALNAFVGFTPRDGLDVILGGTPAPADLDFVSIDVDGNDYHIWKAMARYRPKLVCIEFNPTIPTEVRFVQDADPSISQGASLLSLVDLGKAKGYELVCVMPWNAFFVDSTYYPLFEMADNRPEFLRRDLNAVTYLFSGYDGTLFLRGSRHLPWHGVVLDEAAMQPLPRVLRKFPGNYDSIEKAAFAQICNAPSHRRQPPGHSNAGELPADLESCHQLIRKLMIALAEERDSKIQILERLDLHPNKA
jgi:hypothetical protein